MAKEDPNKHDQETSSPTQKSKATAANHDEVEVEAATGSSKVVGPSLSHNPNSDGDEQSEASDDSSDDDFGPQLPPAGATESNDSKYTRDSRYSPPAQHTIATESTATKKRQRDDWMVVPPENQSWASGMNPTALTNRKFNTGKSARGDQSSGGIGAAWTENPTQKRQRLENEVLGIKAEPDARSAKPRDLSSRANTTTANKVKSLSVSTYFSSRAMRLPLIETRRIKAVSPRCTKVTKRVNAIQAKKILVHGPSAGRKTLLEKRACQVRRVRNT
jgi:Protein of unknown function (DUF3752)